MSVSIGEYGGSPAPVIMSRNQISQFTNRQNATRAYDRERSQTDPDMRGADTIKYDPQRMVGQGAGLGIWETDPSAQRVITEQRVDYVKLAGGAIILLLFLNYLRMQSTSR